MENSLSVHTDNRERDMLVLGEGPRHGLDDTIITAEAKYFVNIPRKKICFNLVWEKFQRIFQTVT